MTAQVEEKRPVYKLFSGFAFAFPRWQRALIPIYLWFCAVALGLSAHGQVVANWTGGGHDSLWTDSKNWSPHSVPGSNDTANIDLSGSNFVVLNTNLFIGTINLGGQGTNILQLTGVSIQCTGSISITNGGILEIVSNSVVVGGSVRNSGSIKVPANLGTQSLTLMCNFTNTGVLDAETNSVLSLPGTNSFTPEFLAGTAFTGSGAIQFPAGNAKINCLGSIAIAGTVVERQAVLGSSTWIGPGQFQWLGGSISNVTFAPSLTVQIGTIGPKFVYGTCTNQGVMIWMPGAGGFAVNTNAHFFNTGLFQLEDNCSLGNVGGVFENDGTVDVPSGLGGLSLTINCDFFNHGTIDVDTNSILDITTASPNILDPVFSPGTVFDGAGTVELTSSIPITGFGQIRVNGTVIFNSIFNSIQTANTVWAGPGLLQFTGGEMSNVTFAAGFDVEMLGPDSKTLNGACTNQGTILYLGTGSLLSDSTQPGQFYNAGLFQIETNCELDAFTNFQNTGTIEVPAGLAELSLNCNFTNYGTIDVETNSSLAIVTPLPPIGTSAFEPGTVFAGPGTVAFDPNAIANFAGTITVDGTVVLNYSVVAANAIWTGSGLLQFPAGYMTNVTFAPGFNVQILVSEYEYLDGPCTNQGTIRVLGAGHILASNGGQFYNAGLFQIETNCDLSLVGLFGNSTSPGFQNTGTIKIPAGLGNLSLTTDCAFTNYGVIDIETNSALSFANPYDIWPIAFESGTVFAGAGTVELVSLGALSIDGMITADGTVVLNSELSSGNAVWTGPGLLQFIAGGMNNVTFASGFDVQVIGPDSKTFNGSCTNEGTIRVLGTGVWVAPPFPFNTCLFYNNGLLQIETNFDLNSLIGFQNTGTIKVPPGLGLQSLTLDCSFTNAGVIDVETNSELVISNDIEDVYASQTYFDGTIFNGSGVVSLASDYYGAIQCCGSMTDNCALNLQSGGMFGTSTWTGSGRFGWFGGAISNITFEPGFHAQISGPNAKFITGVCTNLGTVCWLGGSQLNDSATSGQFYNSGTLQITSDGTWNNIPVNNQAGGTFRQLAGTFSVPSFSNMGSVQAVTGFLNVATNFFSCSNSSYQLTVSGTTPGTNFNQLNAQNLTLNGSLQVVLTNGFSPSIGNSFAIMTGSRSGSFSSTTLPAPQGNLMWHVQYSPTSVALEVAETGALTDMGFANGAFQFSLNGLASGSYDIQTSSNLIDWTTILTNYPFSGSVTVTDTNAAEFSLRFYRARIFP